MMIDPVLHDIPELHLVFDMIIMVFIRTAVT